MMDSIVMRSLSLYIDFRFFIFLFLIGDAS